jgi:hypothetical protein
MSNLPVPVRHPSVVRAAVSPSALILTGAGVVIGLVLLQSIILAVVLGAGAWAGHMVAALIAQARRERAARPKPAALDPYSVPEPWRQLVQQAANAQSRFDQTIKDWPPGPIQDRLLGLRPRLYSGMEEVGVIARRGAALGGWTGGAPTTRRPTAAQLSDQLKRLEAERRQVSGQAPGREATLARSEEAVAAQLRAVRGAEDAAAMVQDRLRVLVARLDESVTSLLVLGVDGSESGAESLEETVNELTDEITALHRGLTDATASSTTPLASPPAPSPLPYGSGPEDPLSTVARAEPPPEPPTP